MEGKILIMYEHDDFEHPHCHCLISGDLKVRLQVHPASVDRERSTST